MAKEPTRVIVAGATGWAGSALARGIARSDDLRLVAAVGRTDAGKRLGDVLRDGAARLDAPVHASAAAALASPCDVFVDYTHAASAKAHVLAALAAGAHVVVGTSGLTGPDYDEIDALARSRNRGVLACGNFALTVVLLHRFAEMAAKYVPDVEILDYASAGKPDAPSGTARELAHRVGRVRRPATTKPVAEIQGAREARGTNLDGVQVLSLRSPGFVLGVEAIFGLPGQRLHLKHEAGDSAEPYVDGALLAIRRVHTLVGVHRGLDRVMDL
jgi:4-hydroxy-tetrahydrodipicolinate reductase